MQGSERYGPKPAPKTEACVWLETTMPHRSRLPLEILDYIVDFLHDERDTLKNCCLVSKSWVPRTRQHLFGDVKFHSATDLMLWKETFPDQSDSPACHTHTLFVACPEEVTAVDAERGGWIPSFSRVVELVVYSNPSRLSKPVASLTPFCVLSPVLKSLHIRYSNLSNSQIFDLIRSLPLLEDLTLYIRGIDDDVLDLDAPSRVFQPTSPAFTGTLDLTVFKKLQPTARRFLDLSGGLHFRELVLSCLYVEDIQWINTLVVKCSDALERLTLRSTPHGSSSSTPIDLSKAIKLKGVVFISAPLHMEWIAPALQTITPKHRDFRSICIHLPHDRPFTNPGVNVRQSIGEVVYGQWLALDCVLVQLWESRSIRLKMTYVGSGEENGMVEAMGCLLPEAMKRGIMKLVDTHRFQ